MNIFLDKKRNAFSLIELSIVLLVLGFLISGVLVGRTIIQNAKVQSIVNNMIDFQKNYQMFINTYASVPGKITYEACIKEQKFIDAGICGVNSPGGIISVGQSLMTWNSNSECLDCGAFGTSSSGRKGDTVLTTIAESAVAIRFMAAANLISFRTDNINYGPNGKDTISYVSMLDFNNFFPKSSSNQDLFLVPSGVSSFLLSSTGTTKWQALAFPWVGLESTAIFADKNFLALIGSHHNKYALNALTMKALDLKIDDGLPYSGVFLAAKPGDGMINSSHVDKCTGKFSAMTSTGMSSNNSYDMNIQNQNGQMVNCIGAFLLDQ